MVLSRRSTASRLDGQFSTGKFPRKHGQHGKISEAQSWTTPRCSLPEHPDSHLDFPPCWNLSVNAFIVANIRRDVGARRLHTCARNTKSSDGFGRARVNGTFTGLCPKAILISKKQCITSLYPSIHMHIPRAKSITPKPMHRTLLPRPHWGAQSNSDHLLIPEKNDARPA